MPRTRSNKWPNEAMWEQCVAWRQGGLTYSDICGRLSRSEIMEQFGLQVVPSEDTVRREVVRLLDRAAETTQLTIPEAAVASSLALQLELSKHWEELRGTARTLRGQLFIYWEQLLGFSNTGYRNDNLFLSPSGDQLDVTLQIESGPLFAALQQHSQNHQVWGLLEQWKQAINRIWSRLRELCSVVLHDPLLAGWYLIPQEKPRGSSPGITDRFAQTVVMQAAEDASHNRPLDAVHQHFLEIRYQKKEPDHPGALWKLEIENFNDRYLLAYCRDEEQSEELRLRHMELCVSLQDHPHLKRLMAELHSLAQVQRELDWQSSKMEFWTRYTGACDLCSS